MSSSSLYLLGNIVDCDHHMSSVITALMSMHHSFEYIAPLVVNSCCLCGNNISDEKNVCWNDDSSEKLFVGNAL